LREKGKKKEITGLENLFFSFLFFFFKISEVGREVG
jgi:hypothetical protein